LRTAIAAPNASSGPLLPRLASEHDLLHITVMRWRKLYSVAMVFIGCGDDGPAHDATDPDSGTSGDQGLALKEYHMQTTGQLLHVRVLGPSEARVTVPYRTHELYSIERSPGTVLGADAIRAAGAEESPFALRGPVIFRPVSLLPDAEIVAIAANEGPLGELGSEALILHRQKRRGTCLGPGDSYDWQLAPTTTMPDDTATSFDVLFDSLPLFGPVLPWDSFEASASKPSGATLSEVFTVQIDGRDAEIAWRHGEDDTFRQAGSFARWSSLLGRPLATVTFVGAGLTSTNGAAQSRFTIGESELALDLGPARTAAMDFRAGVPSDLLAWPDAPADATAVCPDGCLWLPTYRGVALRFAGPARGVRLRYRSTPTRAGTALVARVVAPDGRPQELFFASSSDDAFVDATALLDGEPGERFVALSVPMGSRNPQIDPNCAEPVLQDVYIESIEPISE
jgi:hypothetical protein